MKLLFKFLPVFALTMLFAPSVYAQYGSMHGKVTDRDGKPVAGAVVVLENLITERGQLMVRERLEAKTNRNGEFSQSGIYQGQYRVTLLQNGKPIMQRGADVGDAIFVGNGLDVAVNFDLKNAPAAPPPAPDAAAAAGGGDREADRARAEAEKKAAEETRNAFNAGIAAMKANNYEEAIKNFTLAAEKDPKQHVIFAQLGMAYLNTKKYEDSAAAFQKAIEIKADEPAYHTNLSLALANAGKIEEANQSVEKLIALNPSAAGTAYYNLGAVLSNRGKFKDAADAFKKSTEADPNKADAYYQLGIAYFGQAETIPQAVPMLEKYLQLDPNGKWANEAKQLIEASKAQAPTGFKSERVLEQEKKAAEQKQKQKSKN